MNAGGEPKARVTLSQNARGVGVLAVGANGNTGAHAGGFGGVQFLFQAIAKWRVGEMAVRVDHVELGLTVPLIGPCGYTK